VGTRNSNPFVPFAGISLMRLRKIARLDIAELLKELVRLVVPVFRGRRDSSRIFRARIANLANLAAAKRQSPRLTRR